MLEPACVVLSAAPLQWGVPRHRNQTILDALLQRIASCRMFYSSGMCSNPFQGANCIEHTWFPVQSSLCNFIPQLLMLSMQRGNKCSITECVCCSCCLQRSAERCRASYLSPDQLSAVVSHVLSHGRGATRLLRMKSSFLLHHIFPHPTGRLAPQQPLLGCCHSQPVGADLPPSRCCQKYLRRKFLSRFRARLHL
jgi:hypothetical protein